MRRGRVEALVRLSDAGFLLGSLLLAQCSTGSPSPAQLELLIKTESDAGRAVSGVKVWVDGEFVGVSQRGRLSTRFSRIPGSTSAVRYECPEGFVAPEPTLVLRTGRDTSLSTRNELSLELQLRCEAKIHIAGFVVRVTPAVRLPIVLNDDVVATTDERGFALFSIRAPAGLAMDVRLDTDVLERPRPVPPTYGFVMGAHHRMFVIDEAFEAVPKRREVRKRRRIIKIE